MEKISIIIPVFNAEKYLEKCLESVINQTLSDIQIIVINDGSTDKSSHIIKKYLHDKRIIYIEKKNTGIGHTRNLGIERANGEYLTFLDSDDFLELNFCKEMYNKALFDNSDMVVCDYYEIIGDKKNKVEFKYFEPTNIKNNPELLLNVNLGPCNKIFSKRLFEDKSIRFAEGLKYEDLPFVCKMLCSSNKITKLNKYLHNYVLHDKSETTTHDTRIFDILKILEDTYKYLKENSYPYDLLTYFIFRTLIDYIIKQRYYENKNMRNEFIVKAYHLMDKIDKKWKKNINMKQLPFVKRTIVSCKPLIKLYCELYFNFKYRKS